MKSLSNFRRILHETPKEVKLKISRNMANYSKIFGIKRRLLYKKYKPAFPKAKNREQGRLIYLAERKNNNVFFI